MSAPTTPEGAQPAPIPADHPGHRILMDRLAELEAQLEVERRRAARLGAYAHALAGFSDDVSEEGALEEYFSIAAQEVEILELATQSQSTFPVSVALGRLWDRMRAMNDGAEEIARAHAEHHKFRSLDARQGKAGDE